MYFAAEACNHTKYTAVARLLNVTSRDWKEFESISVFFFCEYILHLQDEDRQALMGLNLNSSLLLLSLSLSLSPLCRVSIHVFPETNHVPRGYIVTAILSLLFLVPLFLVPALALLFFYVSTYYYYY